MKIQKAALVLLASYVASDRNGVGIPRARARALALEGISLALGCSVDDVLATKEASGSVEVSDAASVALRQFASEALDAVAPDGRSALTGLQSTWLAGLVDACQK